MARPTIRRSAAVGLAIVFAVAFACVLAGAWSPAAAQVPDADKRCLGCHSRPGLFKRLGDSSHMPLVVAPDAFARSEHATQACTSCHTGISLKTHPKDDRPAIASARSFALSAGQVCQTCHPDAFHDWQSSIHAALVQAGNANGPVCTSCHQPHSEVSAVPASMDAVACKSCHETIFAAYAGSVHGHAVDKGDAGAPLCFDCHNAHDVSVASSPGGPETSCVFCHNGVEQSHATWLPNAALHLEVVSCPACHVPNAPRSVDLQLVEKRGQTRIAEKAGVPTFETPGKSVDAIALYNLLHTFNPPSMPGEVALRGRLEVSTAEQIHQLAPKEQAISDCATCHSAGAEAFSNVTISVAGPDGLPVRHVVDKDVLKSVRSLGSIGGFYAVGGTRIELLDVLLMLAVLAGIGLPGAHLLLGVLVRRRLSRHSAMKQGE